MSSSLDGSTTVEGQTEVRYDPRGTSEVVRRWVGRRAEIDTKSGESGIAGYPQTITPVGDSPCAELTVTYAGGASVVETPISEEWIFRAGMTQAPLVEHPNYASKVRSLTATQKDDLRKVISGETAWTDYTVPDSDADIQELVEIHMEGISSYLRPDPIFTYQARYHLGASFRPNYSVIGLIYTKTQMESETGAPSDVQAGIPSGDWLCEDIEYEAAADGSRVYSVSFRYAADWDSRLYTAAT